MEDLINNKKLATAHEFYDATKQMPVQNPTEDKDKRLGIYKWGSDNLYPNYLASLFYNCAVHNGVIRSKVHYTVSGGLTYKGVNEFGFNNFMRNGNSDYNMNEICELLSLDLEVYNGYAYTINFVSGKPYQINHVSFASLRMNIDGNWEGSEDWSDKKQPIKEYNTLDINERVGEQLVVYMERPMQIKLGRRLTKGIYPAPPYAGGIKAIETDILINDYRSNEIYNNFSLGTIINFNNGQPATPEDKDMIINEVRQTGQGTANAGGVMAVFTNGKDTETTVTNMTGNNLDQRYLALSKDNKENILLSHNITNPMLFGIKTEGQLGGATELATSYNLMKSGYFSYRQRAILNTLQFVFNRLAMVEGDILFNEVTLDLPQPQAPTQNTFNFNTESNNETELIKEFAKVGRTKEGVTVLNSRALDVENFDEDGFMKEMKFAPVTDMQINVLSMINDGSDFDSIRGSLNIPASNLSAMYDNLTTEGLLSDGQITSAGLNTLASHGKVVMKVVYSYEVRPELNQPDVIPTTRDFCRELIALNRFYTRDEINTIGQRAESAGLVENSNVWTYRGGWYRNPNGQNTPFCRHYWQQNIVIE